MDLVISGTKDMPFFVSAAQHVHGVESESSSLSTTFTIVNESKAFSSTVIAQFVAKI